MPVYPTIRLPPLRVAFNNEIYAYIWLASSQEPHMPARQCIFPPSIAFLAPDEKFL